MNLKRDRLKVIYDILKVIQNKNGKIKPTHIIYKANLSHSMLDEYLKDLIVKGFVEEKKDKKSIGGIRKFGRDRRLSTQCG